MNILVLGGSGILSSAVCKEALGRGISVTCVTRGNRDFALPKGVVSVRGDINRIDLFINKIDSFYDAVIDFLTLDLDGLKYKLSFLGKLTNQYFFVSSATAYKFVDGKITEDTPLENQYWEYGQNKAICEKYLKDFCSGVLLKYTIIRPYITYGNTRIPFAIISNGRYWSLAARILNEKPIIMWDKGNAICTLTHTKDFANGFVDLIGNENAYNMAFHITSDETFRWIEVLGYIEDALGKKSTVFPVETKEIISILPEFAGVLLGDKARNRIFDNSLIKRTAPSFRDFKPFRVGIKETVEYYLNNQNERQIDYLWDGRMDFAIKKIARQKGIKGLKVSFCPYEQTITIRDYFKYLVGRYSILYWVYSSIKHSKDYRHG